MKEPKTLLIYTGGTIGMQKNPDTGTLEPFDFSQIKEALSEIKNIGSTIDTFSFSNLLDSSNINSDNWIQIAEVIKKHYNDYTGFVVLHGTDTMAFTTSALSFMLKGLQKPIIFTGSQLPIGHLRTDAKENLITSLEIAALQDENGEPLIKEVALYFQHNLYRANRVTKVNADHFNAFDSPNFEPLANSGVRLTINKHLLLNYEDKKFCLNTNFSNDIFVVYLFPSIKKEFLEAVFEMKNLKGIVMLSFGSGNTPNYDWFLNILKDAVRRGISIVNVTQCEKGAVTQGEYQVSEKLNEIGIISGKDITIEAAITKLMFLIGNGIAADKLKEEFEKPLKGELTA